MLLAVNTPPALPATIVKDKDVSAPATRSVNTRLPVAVCALLVIMVSRLNETAVPNAIWRTFSVLNALGVVVTIEANVVVFAATFKRYHVKACRLA